MKDKSEDKHSLTQFRNIIHDVFIKRVSDNKQLFVDNVDFFKEEYDIEYNVNKIGDSVYAISTIRTILKTQDCYLKSMDKNIDGKMMLCYSIVGTK